MKRRDRIASGLRDRLSRRLSAALPPRPFFGGADSPFRRAAGMADADTGLGDLDYVVFDTETTGLHPERGDRIVQIAAIRVAGGRPVADDLFDLLVNPGRDIPERSIRFHGITDAMVADAPGIDSVLPDFAAFAGDAVLVGQNVAFDLAFLRPVQARTGIALDNPVLDTMLFSMFLNGFAGDHTLDALAERYRVDVAGRHTALGDARVTAGVLIGQLPALEARGVTTLGDALDAVRRASRFPGLRRLR